MTQKVLPAYVGMIPEVDYMVPNELSAPRIRGDDPWILRLPYQLAECSPHTRG